MVTSNQEEGTMRAEAQIAAPRANVVKSPRPATTIGRRQALLEACHREFQPKTDIDIELVTEIAAARCRLRHCWSMETSLFDMEIAKQRENPEFAPQDYEFSTRLRSPRLRPQLAPHGPL